MKRTNLLLAVMWLAVATTSGCTYVSLTHFYDKVPAGTPLAIDPIGGYLLLYWVDEQGNACHGLPGTSGQPGPAALSVASTAALQDAAAGATIPATNLAGYQMISYSLGDYVYTNASGPHFFQFDNLLWRQRDNGSGFRDSSSHYYSAPQVIDVDHLPPTLYPVHAWGSRQCAQSQFIVAGSPLQGAAQHPTLCRRKALPVSNDVAEDRLFGYCLKALPEGSRYATY